MSINKYTEEFFDALRIAYYGDEAGMLSEYLRGECRLLLYLNISEEESVQPGKIAEKLGISTARVASILKALESKGMIVRRYGTADKRKVFEKLIKTTRHCSLRVPSNLDIDNLKPHVENGLLRITIPVAETAKPKIFTIE
jgi:DNA-binding MarR family transcriptional regulator